MKRIDNFQNNKDIPFSLNQLVNDVITKIAPDAKSKKIEIVAHFSELLPQQIIGSKECICPILENLLHYLLRYSNWGNIFLNVDIIPKKGRKSKDKINIRFTFQDSGAYIVLNKDKLDINNLSRASFEDLKLFTIKQTVEEIKGSLNVESNNNATTLILSLPFQISDITSDSEEYKEGFFIHDSDEKSQKLSPIYKILVIEDDPICQNVFKVLLEELGYITYIAGTAQMGLKFLENNPNFLFVDIGLPDRDGMSLVKEIREKYKITVPIVATTAYEWEHGQFVQVGFTEVMKKPISREKIQHTLFRLLHHLYS